MMIPISPLSSVYPAYIFYEREVEKPALWIAIYASVAKCISGVAGTIFIIGAAVNIGSKCIYSFIYLN